MTLLLTLGLLGCTDATTSGTDDTATTLDETDTGDTGTTTDTVDTVDTTPPCTVTVSGTEPESDDDDVFWRSPLQVWFDGSFLDLDPPALALTADADGSAIAVTQTWDEGVDSVVLDLATPLDPLAAYTLTVDACEQTWTVPFTTSDFGSPIMDGPASLLDRTWLLQTGDVAWTQPEGAAELLGTFFTDPLLIGVQDVRGDVVDLLVGIGGFTDLGGFEQLIGQGTWDVLDVDLSQGAWFEGVAESIVFTYAEVEIPVHDFALQGTFAADGSAIEGASIKGLVDTRNIATLFGLDQEDFICTTYAQDYGLECTLCPDDELLCLDLAGQDITLDEQVGLTLVRNALEEDISE